ncbi:MAG: RHS repeat-associated core domain-containing protein, partial [Sphingomicrobium sp.]
YTGQQFMSELSLTGQPHAFYYYKARIYRADIGRFLQTDPVGYDGGINLYAYVGDDPVDRTDPNGLLPAEGSPQDEAMREAAIEMTPKERLGWGLATLAAAGAGFACLAGACEAALSLGARAPGISRATAVERAAFQRATSAFPKQLQQTLRMETRQIQRSLRSFEKNVADHKGWLADPKSKIKNWDQLSSDQKRNILHHWKEDVKRNEAYATMARRVLNERLGL